jgi:hypothetical protein
MAKTAVSAPFPAPDDDDREAVSKLKPDSPSHKEENPMAATSDAVSKPVDPTTPNPAAVEVPPTPAAPPQPPARPIPPDPFDPSSLRLGSDYSEGLGVRKVISTIPNRKPNRSEWFRVRPGADWRLQTAVLELERGVERSTYLVAPALWPDLSGEITPALLLTCVNQAGDLFLWRIKLPGPDGRSNTWTESALQIALAAETTWGRMVSDTTNGIYTHYEPTGVLPDPKWPDLSFPAMLKIAFRDRMIDTIDHPVLRDLRGGA